MALHNRFVYKGESGLQYGLLVEDKRILRSAEPDVDEYQVPGRDGTVCVSNNRYQNVEISYDTFFKAPEERDVPIYATELKRWLLADPAKYYRLEDSYDPDHYRMARYSGGLDPDNIASVFGRQTIQFTCLPWRWKISGEIEIELPGGISGADQLELYNSTGYTARPLIKLAVSGTGGVTIKMTDESKEVYYEETLSGITPTQGLAVIDCEEQRIYDVNGKIMMSNVLPRFPELHPGTVTITVSGDSYTGGIIIPRYREL